MPTPNSFARRFFGTWGWLFLTALFIAILAYGLGAYGGQINARLAANGADATATITAKRTDGDFDDTYYLDYIFGVGEITVEARQNVSATFYDAATEGDTLPVRYWREDPTVSEVEPGAAALLQRTGSLIAAAAVLCAALCGLIAGWQARKTT